MRDRFSLIRFGLCLGTCAALGLSPGAWAEEPPAVPAPEAAPVAPAPEAAPAAPAPEPAPAPEAAPAAAPAEGALDFATVVWPILESRCLSCHGAEKPKAGLRLDSPENILKGVEDGPVLIAGDIAGSSLYQRVILPADHDDIMPPKGDPLTPEQTAILERWITEGASFGAWTGPAPVMAEQVAAADAGVKTHTPDGAVTSTFEARLEALAAGVAPAPEEALAPLRDLGALVMPLDQKTPLLRVSLQLLGDQAGDEQLALLAPLKEQITWLNLGGTAVTDAGLAQLASFPRLTMLHLERTDITDAGVAHLGGLAHLDYLNLYATKVTDAGLDSLMNLPELHKLYLWQSGVTEEGATKLATAKPGLVVDTGAKLVAPVPEAAPAAEAMPAPEAAPAEAAPAEAPAAPAIDLARFFDAGGCCAAAKAEGKECEHPCCVEARAAGTVCEKCNAAGAKSLALVKQFTPDSCCAKAFAEGKECDHPCCAEARAKGEVCAKCNPKPEAPVAPVSLEAQFTAGSCCATAHAEGKECEHPCCVEARAKGEVCAKCNAKPEAPVAPVALEAQFTAGSCCATAHAEGKECDHPCCVEARAKGEVCAKCNPKPEAPVAPVALEAQFKAGGCCATAHADGKECDHPCCVEARAKGEVCGKCNA